MPQCVISSAPSLLNFVETMPIVTGSTTIPIKLVKALSAMVSVKSDGAGVIISWPVWAKGSRFLSRGAPPVVTITLSNCCEGLSAKSIFSFPSCVLLMAFIACCVTVLMPSFSASPVRQLMIACESCALGNTHWSACVTNCTPCLSNHWYVLR